MIAPGLGLAVGHPDVGGLQAVVEGVADQVDQRVADLLHHRLVELGGLAVDLQLHLLAQLARQVAHQAGEAVEREADREHADLHHAALELPGVALQVGQALLQLLQVDGVAQGQLLQHRLGDDELAHHVDERVDLLDVDPDGGGGGGRPVGGFGLAPVAAGPALGVGGSPAAGVPVVTGPAELVGCADLLAVGAGPGDGVGVGGGGGGGVEPGDRDLGVVLHPLEDLLDGALLGGAFELDGPRRVAALDVEVGQGREGRRVGFHRVGAQLGQLAQDAYGIVAGAEEVGLRLERDPPGAESGAVSSSAAPALVSSVPAWSAGAGAAGAGGRCRPAPAGGPGRPPRPPGRARSRRGWPTACRAARRCSPGARPPPPG